MAMERVLREEMSSLREEMSRGYVFKKLAAGRWGVRAE